jgi:hypothetical protein
VPVRVPSASWSPSSLTLLPKTNIRRRPGTVFSETAEPGVSGCSFRHLWSAVLLAAALTGLAVTGSERYIRLGGLAALLTGGMLFAARLARLGFLAQLPVPYRAGGVPDRCWHPGRGRRAAYFDTPGEALDVFHSTVHLLQRLKITLS